MDIRRVKTRILRAREQGWFTPETPHLEFQRRGNSPRGYREAAVLFLINKDLKVLVTKRSMEVSSFKGQACLPGGSFEQNDKSLISTALREAQEEVGLNPRDVEVVCAFPPCYTIYPTLTLVTPVVAITMVNTDSLNLQPDPTEVDSLYWVPLQFFIGCKKRLLKRSGLLAVYGFDFEDPDTKLCHFIYGLTSHLCMYLSSLVLHATVLHAPHYKPYFIKEASPDQQNSDLMVLHMAKIVDYVDNTISKL